MRVLRPDLAAVDIAGELLGCRDMHGNLWPPREGIIGFVASKESAGGMDTACSHAIGS